MFNSIQENALFWFFWAATLAVCVQQTWHSLKRPETALGYMPVFCMMFGYFYVVQAAIVAFNFGDRIPPSSFAIGQALSLACLVATVVGWHFGLGRASHGNRRGSVPTHVENPSALFGCGVVLMLIGIIGQYSFGASGADYTNSAYWYLLFHVTYPGFAICVNLMSRRPEYRGGAAIFVLLLAGIFIGPYIVAGRRGPLFPFVVCVIYGFYLARPKRVNRLVVFGSLAGVGLTMLLFFTLRTVGTVERSLWEERRVERITAADVIVGKAYAESDNEFLYHCATVETLIELGRFQWGTGYLSLTIHWIPRTWWPDKPRLATGWLDVIQREEMFAVTGVKMTFGASAGGVAETFTQLSWLVPFFWFGLGWFMSRLFNNNVRNPSGLAPIIYISIVAASHWLVSQGFGEAFVPGMVYITCSVGVYLLTRQRILRRPKARNPEPVLAR